MARHSFVKLLALSALRGIAANPQAALTGAVASGTGQFLATQLPDLVGSASASATGGCGGCYLVADVAALVWYSEAFVQTAATAMVSVGVGNGSAVTRTSIVQGEGQFTFNPQGSGGAALSAVPYDSTLKIGGATLSSPTPYNLFTAYSVTSAVFANGVCSTFSGAPVTLSTPYSEVLSSASGQVYLDQAGEQQFVNALGFSSCSAVGISANPTALVPVTSTTATQTNTYSGNTPLAALTSKSSSASASPASSATLSQPKISAPVFVIGNSTITPAANPFGLPTLKINGSVVSLSATATGPVTLSSPSGAGGTGKGNYSSATIVPFVNQAPSNWKRSDGALFTSWMLGMLAMGFGIYYV